MGALQSGTKITRAVGNTVEFSIDENETHSFLVTASLVYDQTKKATVSVQLEGSASESTEVAIHTDSVDADGETAVYDLSKHNASSPMNFIVETNNQSACASPAKWEREVVGAATAVSVSTSGNTQEHAQILLGDAKPQVK